MPNKTQECLNLAQQTAKELTRYWENWTDYLTTASRLYKYSFADQLMIYAQRPDATACASFDIWNNRMNRYVRRGSKGIALLDQSSSVLRLHYVFDVSDTGVRRNPLLERPPLPSNWPRRAPATVLALGSPNFSTSRS